MPVLFKNKIIKKSFFLNTIKNIEKYQKSIFIAKIKKILEHLSTPIRLHRQFQNEHKI